MAANEGRFFVPLTAVINCQVLLLLFITSGLSRVVGEYYGARIGQFTTTAHDIQGTVFAVDEDTFFVKGFTYDGNALDAYFWVGKDSQPSPRGVVIPYPSVYSGRDPPKLKKSVQENVILNLPNGMKFSDVSYIAIWSRRFTVNFAHVTVPRDLRVPRQVELAQFSRLGHGVKSGNVTILDERTFYIPNLNFDGLARDTFFLAGRGFPPAMDEQSMFVYVPDEQGKRTPLRKYIGEDIEIQLPESRTIHEFEWLSIFCKSCNQNFGHVKIPRSILVPPALGQTKITPPWWYVPTTPPPMTMNKFPNCIEPLPGRMQVRWALDDQDLLIQLSGKLLDDQYMAFGLSPSRNRPQMIGADVTVAFYDKSEGVFEVQDYFLKGKAECDGRTGVCPDTRFGGRDDVEFTEGSVVEGVTVVTFRRPLVTSDPVNDLEIRLSEAMNIIAAIGPLNERREPRYHNALKTSQSSETRSVKFSNVGRNTCGPPLSSSSSSSSSSATSNRPPSKAFPPRHKPPFFFAPWEQNEVAGVAEFRVQIGPSGGSMRGYEVMTGRPNQDIAWWINGLLAPELYLERGKTYNFTVEGGNDPRNPSKTHQLYITDSPTGGFQSKNRLKRAEETIYAGVSYDAYRNPTPTAKGRLCEWTQASSLRPEDYEVFEDFKRSLRLECDDLQGSPGQLIWTVPHDAPNELYYQCYSHEDLGWKIHIRQPGFRLRHGEENSSTEQSPSSWSLVIICAFSSSILNFFYAIKFSWRS